MENTNQTGNLRRGDISLGIVCPMANEEKTVVDFVESVLEKCAGFKSFTLFAVLDNVCKDGTVELLKELAGRRDGLEVVWSPENRCVVDAYIRGYNEAIGADCDWILEMDAGFSHSPDDMELFFAKMEDGYDCVFGSRFCSGGSMSESPFSRRFISQGGTFLANTLLGTKLKDMTSGFEMFTRQSLEMVIGKGIRSKGHFFQTEIKAYCKNLRIAEVPIQYRAPSASVNKSVVLDAFGNLFYMFKQRLRGKL